MMRTNVRIVVNPNNFDPTNGSEQQTTTISVRPFPSSRYTLE